MLNVVWVLFAVFGLLEITCGSGPIINPEYALAKAGSSHRFSCTVTQDEPVYWSVRYFGSQITKDICIGEKFLLDEFATSGRFSVFNKTLNTYDLIINNTQKTDGGAYICTDERGLGKKTFAELIVWDAVMCNVENPSDDFMGENVFNLKKDVIISTCSLNYTGNNRPRLIWFLNGSKFENVPSIPEPGAVFSRLNLTAKSEHNGANITCEAIIEDQTSSAIKSSSGLLWTSPALHVTYAMLKNDTTKECPGLQQILDCCPPCSYNLEAYDNGTVRCLMGFTLKCHTKSLIYSLPVSVSHSENPSSLAFATAIVIACVVVGILCLVIGVVIGKFLRTPKGKLCQKRRNGTKVEGDVELNQVQETLLGEVQNRSAIPTENPDVNPPTNEGTAEPSRSSVEIQGFDANRISYVTHPPNIVTSESSQAQNSSPNVSSLVAIEELTVK